MILKKQKNWEKHQGSWLYKINDIDLSDVGYIGNHRWRLHDVDICSNVKRKN